MADSSGRHYSMTKTVCVLKYWTRSFQSPVHYIVRGLLLELPLKYCEGKVQISGILELSLFQSDLNFASLKCQLWNEQYWPPLLYNSKKSTKIWLWLIKTLLQLLLGLTNIYIKPFQQLSPSCISTIAINDRYGMLICECVRRDSI